MESNYLIMRKNEPVTMAVFDESGTMLDYSKKIRNIELAPIQDRYQLNWLKEWWKMRSVPLSQGQISDYLKKNGFVLPSEYLIKNLGLSLTDYYWIKPVDSDFNWEDVNLFDNDFTDNLLEQAPMEDASHEGIPHFSPNSSLQGTIEKTWAIREGERYLIKGNKSNLSAESINELIACEIHRCQGYGNFAEYRLLEISGRPYDYGCYTRLFSSQKTELVSAFAIYTFEKKPNGVSHFKHFLNMCGKLGIDADMIRRDLDYITMTDYILSGYDRHLNNISLKRDADSLRFTGLSPIYDSGGSLFANKPIPKNDRELLNMETYGFCSREPALLKLVSDPEVIDLTKLPPASYVMEMYGKDSQADEKRIKNIAHWYERKIDMCRDFQLGRDISRISISVKKRRN